MTDEEIIELIKKEPRTTHYFATLFNCGVKSASSFLQQVMRRTSLIRVKSRRPRVWVYDGDFVCSNCNGTPPEVRRRQQSTFCTDCFNDSVTRRRLGRQPEPAGNTWAQSLSDYYITRPLTNNPPEIMTYRCRP